MFDYLENLRKQPESVRRKKVLLISIAITLAIALVWGAYMAMRISGTDFTLGKAPSDMPNLGDAFSNFRATVDGIFQNASAIENQPASSTGAPAPFPPATTSAEAR